jgi:hypothetical protein
MLSFGQAVRQVRKDYSPSSDKGRGGNPKLTGDVLSVKDAAEIMRQLLADKIKLDPSTDAVQYVNGLATSSQWSAEVGAAAARRVLEQARRAGGGYSPGFSGPGRGNIDKSASAYDQLVAKAAELRKANPELSEADAFTRVYLSPANSVLAKREFTERMAKIGKAAAA